MNPLVAIAASILPDILKSIVGDQAKPVSDAVVKAVTDATGTADPAQAQQKVDTDPAVAKDLKIKLAEIAAAQEAKQQQAALDAQRLRAEEAGKKQAAQLDELKLRLEQIDKNRAQQFEELKAGLADTQSARETMVKLSDAKSPLVWGPLGLSLLVVVGFFLILLILLVGGSSLKIATNGPVLQIINITVGALAAAFATVISFWLGSSQGSRNKDVASFNLQTQQAANTANVMNKQAEQNQLVLSQGKNGAAPTKPAEEKKESHFDACIAVVLAQVNAVADKPVDSGGATKMGITLRTLQAWRGPDNPVTEDDVRKLTEREARDIYRASYWNATHCDDLPIGVDLVVFDFSVDAGPGQSARLLQRVVGANADGVIGSITVAAVNTLKAENIIRRFGELRLEYYSKRDDLDILTKRIKAVEAAALEMIAA